jgi:hypothetical protein
MYSSVRVPVVLARSCALSVDGCVRAACMRPRRVRPGPVHAVRRARVSGRARTDADRSDVRAQQAPYVRLVGRVSFVACSRALLFRRLCLGLHAC